MPKNLRILTKPNDGDKHVKIRLEQTFDFLEVLSLKLTQADVYRKFAADYGVLVGRVIANGGFGVPNAKVAVFVPIDKNDNSLVQSLYPYETTKDINHEGVRYNLLEDDKQFSCHKPIGTFPNKRKVLDNDVWLEIYDKYYKFTTTTNFAGDYMIFGIPIGNQNIHMDVDLSNIDHISVKPYDLIDQGYNENLFESRTTFKSGTDLGSLVQAQSRDYSVNILPFWGDLEENEVGVNRVDFNLGIEITPTATFFGTIFTDSKKSSVRKKCQPRETLGNNCELATGKGRVEMIRRISRDSTEVELIDLESKQIDENGNWAFTVLMNLDRVVTDDFGNLVPSEDPNVGIPTRSQVRFRMSLEEHGGGLKYRTASYLVPNMYNRFEFGNDTEDFDFFEMRWKKVYTVTNYIPRYQKVNNTADTFLHTGIKDIGECENTAPFPFNRTATIVKTFFSIICLLITVIAAILQAINFIIGWLFEVGIKFMCFLKHPLPFNSNKRAACRCQGCYNTYNFFNGTVSTPEFPPFWLTPPCTECQECAVCYNGDSEGGDSGSTTYSFKTGTTFYPAYIDNIQQGSGAVGPTGYFVTPAFPYDNSQFYVIVDSAGNITNVYIRNQIDFVVLPNYTINIPTGALDFGGASTGYSFDLNNRDIFIFEDDYSGKPPGTYTNIASSASAPGYSYSNGNGNSAIFDITINSAGVLDSITINGTNSGSGYNAYWDSLPTYEVFSTNDPGTLGGIGISFSFAISAFETIINGIDCSSFDYSTCESQCTDCEVSVITLQCNDVPYTNALEWSECIKENLAEQLGVIKYNFYNDWVIGSLYSILFDYKIKLKRKGKSIERFCDFDCRAPGVPIPPTTDPNYKHRKNRCYNASIADSPYFTVDDPACPAIANWEVYEIDSPISDDEQGRGLIVEYDGNLYYSARHDKNINTVTDINSLSSTAPEAGRLIPYDSNPTNRDDKRKLLFATNIIELGSMVSCDIDNEPFLVDNLEATTYQKDNGTNTLFNFNDCFSACPFNRNGIQLMSQAGIEIAFAEAADTPIILGDDGEIYNLTGDIWDIPDYGGTPSSTSLGIIIFDRDDIILRRKLCENFNYYGAPRTYTSTERPQVGDAYLSSPIILPDVAEVLEFTTDVCAGFDDNVIPSQRMHPYYMYFGIRQGQTALDKLRKNYFDRCTD